MKKLTICILILIMILAIVKIAQIRGFDMDTLKNITIGSDKKSEKKLEKTDGLVTVPSLEDEIETDTIWCGTFQLIWNDLKNDLAKQDIVFNPQSKIAENLNKETFTTKDISDKYYYKKIGVPTIELKQEIEKAIKEKFDEKSDILDDFNWDGKTKEDYFLYAMLKKEFQFKTVFDEFENGKFKEYENIKYFGVRKNSDYEKRNQITVLYYDSPENFAIKLKTKQEDEAILCKNPDGKTFNEIYKNIGEKEQNFKGNRNIEENEIVKIPNINLNEKAEFNEIENKPFYFSNGNTYFIEKAIQTIQFELDKTGGKIKSEAGMMTNKASIAMPEKAREFIVDDTFAIFLKEAEKDTPYFAGKINDITKFQ